jgi:O-antigen/teichoic acid export membrane protein
MAIITRYLGQTGFGQYTTVISFLQFFGIIADFGLSLTTTQMISGNAESTEKTMRNILTLRLISSFVFIGLAPFIILFFPYPEIVKWGVFLTAFSFYFITIIQVLTGLFQRELKMFEVTMAEIVGRLVLVILTAIMAMTNAGISWLFIAMSIGSLINLIIVFAASKKYFRFKLAFDREVYREIWQRSWPIALSISFNLLYLKMDAIILSLTHPAADVGLYGAAYRVLDILTMLPAVYMGIMLPHITKAFKDKNHNDLRKLMQQAFDSLMIFAVPTVLGTFLIAEKIMVFVAGGAFALAGRILLILILASAAIFITSLFGYAVVAINRQKTMMWGYLTTAVVTLIGYLIFIPLYGYWGAAWMTVFSEVMVMIWSFVVVYREIKFLPTIVNFIKYVLAAALMMIVLYYIKNLNIVLLLMVATVVYFGTLYLLGGIRGDFMKEVTATNYE